MNAGTARSDEISIRNLIEIVEKPQHYDKLKLVKNAYTLTFKSDGKNCLGFRDYGAAISAPGNNNQVYTFSSVGYVCDRSEKEFDKARIEQTLSALKPNS